MECSPAKFKSGKVVHGWDIYQLTYHKNQPNICKIYGTGLGFSSVRMSPQKGTRTQKSSKENSLPKRAFFKGHSISFWGSTPEGKSVCLHFSCFQTFWSCFVSLHDCRTERMKFSGTIGARLPNKRILKDSWCFFSRLLASSHQTWLRQQKISKSNLHLFTMGILTSKYRWYQDCKTKSPFLYT